MNSRFLNLFHLVTPAEYLRHQPTRNAAHDISARQLLIQQGLLHTKES